VGSRTTPPVLVAPDAFKGTLTAAEVAAALAAGLRAGGATAVERCPMADGGEGTLAALLHALGGGTECLEASGPLGEPVGAELGWLSDGATAVVEVAQASGLELVPEGARDAEAASSRGTGELIDAALAQGAGRVLVAAGGSASTDGGAGALAALAGGGASRRRGGPRITVLCDVQTPYELAATRFAAQKGADAAAVRRLSRRLAELARRLPRDPTGVPMTGAAGGLAGGLWAAMDAELVPGAAFVARELRLPERLKRARAVVTGEGRLDRTTLAGKAVAEVARTARQLGVPAHAVVGRNRLDPFDARILDLQIILEAGTPAKLKRAGRELAGRIFSDPPARTGGAPASAASAPRRNPTARFD
jgi:glycerate kinase